MENKYSEELDDINNMKCIDEELILKLQKQEQKRIRTNGNILR